MPEPIVTIIRPNLTPEEREKRIENIKKCVADFVIAMERRKRDADSD